MQGMSYNDVLSMPTYERRYFLSLKTKDIKEREESKREEEEEPQEMIEKKDKKKESREKDFRELLTFKLGHYGWPSHSHPNAHRKLGRYNYPLY